MCFVFACSSVLPWLRHVREGWTGGIDNERREQYWPASAFRQWVADICVRVERCTPCKECERRSVTSRTLARQLLRADTSIGANVEEDQASQSRADFVNKYAIALEEAR